MSTSMLYHAFRPKGIEHRARKADAQQPVEAAVAPLIKNLAGRPPQRHIEQRSCEGVWEAKLPELFSFFWYSLERKLVLQSFSLPGRTMPRPLHELSMTSLRGEMKEAVQRWKLSTNLL
jgi:hypothetical protein